MFDAGLIVEGGGMRGVYAAGVLDALLDENITIKNCYGVSAGACHLCSYVSGQRGRAFRTAVDYLHDPKYAGFRSLITTGDFFGVDMIYHQIPDRLIPFDHEAFKKFAGNLYATVTDCETGEASYLLVKDMRKEIDFIRASSSLPLLARIVELEGKKYLDGGIADSIPIEKSKADGNRKHVVVLTQHRGYQKGKNGMMAPIRLRYRKYPNFVKQVETRHLRYNETLKSVYRGEEEGSVFVIQPQKPVEIGRLEKDKDKLKQLYEEGVRDTAEKINQLRAFLERP